MSVGEARRLVRRALHLLDQASEAASKARRGRPGSTPTTDHVELAIALRARPDCPSWGRIVDELAAAGAPRYDRRTVRRYVLARGPDPGPLRKVQQTT